MELDIVKALEEDEIMKSWSTDLSKKHPGGKWVTIRGAKIFVDGGGKIVAGNKELRSKLSGDKEGKAVKDAGSVKKEHEAAKKKHGKGSVQAAASEEKLRRAANVVRTERTKKEEAKKPGKTFAEKKPGKYKSQEEMGKMSELDVSKYSNSLREKRNKLPKGSPKRAEIQTEIDRSDKFRSFGEKKKESKKEGLSDRSKGLVERSQKVWDKTPMMEQKKMFEGLEHQLAKHEQGVKNIGMGYDADMVSAAKEFMKKNRSDYDKIIDTLKERGVLKKPEINALKERGLITEKKKETPKPDKKMLASEKKKNTEARKLSNETLDYESTEGLSKLHKHAAKIDNKYLSSQMKNKITDLVEDIKIELYHADLKGYDDRLKGAETLTEALNVAKQLNAQLMKQDTYTMEEDMFVRTQKLIADALIQQTNKKTTEALQYKLF